METTKLKRFAQYARRLLMEQVGSKMKRVLAKDSAARRESSDAVKQLEDQIAESSKDAVVERVAYTWFNRFCALRFMDVNRYTRIGTVSPAVGNVQPEILMEAKQGHIDDSFDVDKQKVFGLLNSSIPSPDPQGEAYRQLLVSVCNYYYKIMPFMFEKIADYTELLMPDDLLSGSSILAYTRESMTPDVCEDVEVIGWLYQFYISEKKDEVFEGLKKNKKITPENIPAATQLFTPHWIVRYLVENSLGRLWMLNKPSSKLVEKMDYYIKPDSIESDFLKISSPEEIKICDPACGSGHMLTYAFDLLYAIYEEEGFDAPDIPKRIFENNLYGIEIDERAGELAAFALVMKAASKHKRFIRKPVQPNICVLENVVFEAAEKKGDLFDKKKPGANELDIYMDEVGKDLFTDSLRVTMQQFTEADNFGSLIRPKITDVSDMLQTLQAKNMGDKLLIHGTHQKVLKVLKQADYLSSKYHVVIANPPYMRAGSMNARLKVFIQDNYPDSKADLFAMFIERNLDMAVKNGCIAMITMQSWMFLSSFEKLRQNILNNNTIISMVHLGPRAFDSIGGEVVSTTAFIIEKATYPDYKGAYLRLTDGSCEAEKDSILKKERSKPFYVPAKDFMKIPGSLIAYWVSDVFKKAFLLGTMSEYLQSEGAVKTGNNEIFLRFLWEVSTHNISINGKWRKHPKGGEYRKWYGNLEWVVDWSKPARQHYKTDFIARIPTENIWDIEGITWTSVASSKPSFRILIKEEIANNSALFVYAKNPEELYGAICYLNSYVARKFLNVLNPTIQFLVGDILNAPKPSCSLASKQIKSLGFSCLEISKKAWDSYEISCDFSDLPIIDSEFRKSTLEDTYASLRHKWQEMTLEMQRLEEENNKIFIDVFELQDELKPGVPLEEITLTCNPKYRYSNDKTDDQLEKLLLADTMKEFISYAVGCMFGRYSLDKSGLILANQGETLDDYLSQIPVPTFEPDDDNVIPMLDEGWFSDDITERFYKFLKVTFGQEHYQENLEFIEEALGKDIRKYFLRDFYGDHVKRYKKRPIYWMFSSPNGSFNALIYMHRYRPDTVSVVLNDYLREFRTKLGARLEHLQQVSISSSASSSDKTKALKDIEKLKKVIDELEDYEREILYPLATKQIEIDLDDGVKVNYNKFGNALKNITGLTEK